MSNRVNVEEVFKNSEGEYSGMSSGKQYKADEVEKIGPFIWTKPAHGADVVEWENEENCTDEDEDFKRSGAKK